MRALLWGCRVFIFLFLFAFAFRNTDLVSIRFFFGADWQAPLIIIVLAFFAAGAALAAATQETGKAEVRKPVFTARMAALAGLVVIVALVAVLTMQLTGSGIFTPTAIPTATNATSAVVFSGSAMVSV